MSNKSTLQEHNTLLQQAIDKANTLPDTGGIIPVGTIEITENGEHDVTAYAKANVNVASSGGGENQLHEMLDGSISVIDSNVTKVVEYGCYGLRSLKTVNLPEVTNIGSRGFYNCSGILSFNAPKTVTLGSYSLYGCIKLTAANFPLAEKVLANTFYNCTGLVTADFGVAVSIASYSFHSCSNLATLILRKSDAIVTLSNTNALSGTPIANGTGYVYVPLALVDSYKTATNWSTYANQFRAIEDYPDITGG